MVDVSPIIPGCLTKLSDSFFAVQTHSGPETACKPDGPMLWFNAFVIVIAVIGQRVMLTWWCNVIRAFQFGWISVYMLEVM